MIVTLVHVWVKPEFKDDFLKETIINHENSVREPGNLRFDILQDDSDENKFVIYEAYNTQADVLAHKETGHYHNWREAVAEMMAKPRVGEKHIVVRPTDKALW